METLIVYLPALACAGAMVVCFRMMRKHDGSGDAAAQRELSELQEELTRLKTEHRTASREEIGHG